VNTLVQGSSFAIIGFLIATLRAALIRESGLSRTDSLTALLNSRAFYEEAGRILALCRRTRRPITVAYMDVDNFKAVNDTRGEVGPHDAAVILERLRSSVARALASGQRSGSVSIGGVTFITVPEDVEQMVQRADARMYEAQTTGKNRVHLEVVGNRGS
jgi:GGDEF domain-containing protein